MATRHTILETQEAQTSGRWRSQEISIGVLYAQREKYTQIPEFQREACWNTADKQSFIDGIFRGLPVQPIMAYKVTSMDNETKYYLIDGQNRLRTLIEYKEKKFATATEAQMRAKDPLLRPIEPGCTYEQLSQRARNIFDDFQIIIYSGEDIDPIIAGVIYRNGNKGKHLTLAETIYSYMSDMTKLASEVGSHPFWSDNYKGYTKRKECFRGGLHVIIMEHAKKPVAQYDFHLHEWASGIKDHLITDDFVQSIFSHLSEARRLYAGVELRKPYEVITLYQSLLFLEKWGYTLSKLPNGCLTPWFSNIQTQIYRQVRYQGMSSQFAQLSKLENQRDFWKKQKPIIEEIAKSSVTGVTQERIFAS